MAKMNFISFDGVDARIYIDKCSIYFSMCQIPPGFQVSTTSIHMIEASCSLVLGLQTYTRFSDMGSICFDTHRTKTMELLSLRHTGSMEEYQRKFEQLVYNIRLFDNSFSTTMLTTQFLMGLKAEVRSVVELQLLIQ
jgi:hypothetical protein